MGLNAVLRDSRLFGDWDLPVVSFRASKTAVAKIGYYRSFGVEVMS
jgi:hypothetical protein